MRALVETRLTAHPVFALATRPKTIIGPLFSRYQPGHAYGAHVDDALIGGARTDVSFTLFLADPAILRRRRADHRHGFGRGSLQAAGGQPGHAIRQRCCIASRPVTRGERMVAAGWVRSYVRDPAQRELLFDLETARRRLFDREGKTAEGDLLAKCAANLMRLWCDD